METRILYEDEQLLVIYKPAGLAVQAAKVTRTDVFSELKAHVKGGFIGLVHRLDQPVEGLLAVGKTKEATADLNKQLTDQVLKKSYLAVVTSEQGRALEQRVTLTDYLIKDSKTQLAKVVPEKTEKAQYAALDYELIKQIPIEKSNTHLMLAKVELETGRFHQIRAQMSHAGMPLIGDQKYGNACSKELSVEYGVRSVALCADQLSLLHPKTKKRMDFKVKPENPAFKIFIE